MILPHCRMLAPGGHIWLLYTDGTSIKCSFHRCVAVICPLNEQSPRKYGRPAWCNSGTPSRECTVWTHGASLGVPWKPGDVFIRPPSPRTIAPRGRLHESEEESHPHVARCFLTLVKPTPSEHHIEVHHYRTSIECSFCNGAPRYGARPWHPL